MKKYVFAMLTLVLMLSIISGCAVLKGFRSSHEYSLNKPPYYQGRHKAVVGAKIIHHPVIVDRWLAYDDHVAAWDELIETVNATLDDIDMSVPVNETPFAENQAPEIFIGDPRAFGSPINWAANDDDDTVTMMLYRQDPTKDWKEWAIQACARQDADYMLFITIGISDYLIRQKNWLGKKEFYLGTGNRKPIKWLASLDDPVEVIHFTGVLIDAQGKIRKTGAEGIISAKTASFLESIVGLRNYITDEAISQITTDAVRKDLADQPLAYVVALNNLVANLLDKTDRVIQ